MNRNSYISDYNVPSLSLAFSRSRNAMPTRDKIDVNSLSQPSNSILNYK